MGSWRLGTAVRTRAPSMWGFSTFGSARGVWSHYCPANQGKPFPCACTVEETQRGWEGAAVLISMMCGELGDFQLYRPHFDSSRSPGQGAAVRRQPDSSLLAKPHAPVQRGQQREGILSLSGPCVWFVFGSKCTGRGGAISQPSQRFPSMSPNPTKGLGDEKEERDSRHA